MNSIQIRSNKKTVKEIYKRYFAYERRNQLIKPIFMLLFATAVIIIVAGFVLDILLIIILGFTLDALLMAYLMFTLMRFTSAYNKMIKDIDSKETEHFEFSFDESKISYVGTEVKQEIKWTFLKTYRKNLDDLYLYDSNMKLVDIVSKQIIGEELFIKFTEVISRKVPGSL